MSERGKEPGVLARNGAYAALNGAYWMLFCVTAGFVGVFLQARGYSSGEIGVILALGHGLGLLIQPVTAAAADRAKTPLTVMTAMAVAAIIMLAALLSTPGQNLLVAGAYVAFLAISVALQPLVNAFAFYLERRGPAVPFGFCRGIGSLSYALLSSLLGVLTVRVGAQVIPAAGLVVVMGMLVIMGWFARMTGTQEAASREKPAQTAESETGQINKTPFLLFLVGTALIFTCHAFINNFMIQVVQGVGGNSDDMGFLNSYIAVLELPVMWIFDRLCRRFSCRGMLRVAAVFFVVKGVLTALTGTLRGLYGALFFQLLSFPLFTPASVRYVGELVSAERINRAQASVTAMITVGNICASAAGGLIIDSFGLKTALTASAACAVAGAAVMMAGLRGAKKTQEAQHGV